MIRKTVVERIKTHFMFNNFFSENHAFCEIMWRRIVAITI